MSGANGPGGRRSTRSLFPAALGLLILLAFAFVGPLLYRVDPTALDLANTIAPRTGAHPLGTDESGRDVLARLMSGGRVTLLVGLGAGLVALLVGALIGGLAAARRPWLEILVGRLLDAAMAVPVFFILLVVVTLFRGGPVALMLAIGTTAWIGIARLVRAEALSLRERDYVQVARALGSSSSRVFRRHLLPHLIPTLSASFGIGVSQAVLTESALSYLGLGVQPPRPSWGNMLTGAQPNLIAAPWLAVYPGILIVASVLACHALAERWRTASESGLRKS